LAQEVGLEPGRRLQRLQQAIPRQDEQLDLVGDLGEGPAPAEAVRKLVTVVVTTVAESAGLDAAATTLTRHGAAVRGRTGDGRRDDAGVAVFGVPTVRENDAERAV